MTDVLNESVSGANLADPGAAGFASVLNAVELSQDATILVGLLIAGAALGLMRYLAFGRRDTHQRDSSAVARMIRRERERQQEDAAIQAGLRR